MKAEYESLQINEVWELVEMPERKNFETGKWHFELKRNSKGEIIKHKARYVASSKNKMFTTIKLIVRL